MADVKLDAAALEVVTVKAFDLTDLKNRLVLKLKDSLKPVAKVAAGEIIDWTSEGCMKHENGFIKGLGGVIIAVKQPILDKIEAA